MRAKDEITRAARFHHVADSVCNKIAERFSGLLKRGRPSCSMQVFDSLQCAKNFVAYMLQKGMNCFVVIEKCDRCKKIHVLDLRKS